MPPADLVETIRTAVQKNREIPAILDAYGEFVDAQIGPLELQNLDLLFARVLENLRQRFPEIASSRAANSAKSDILAFLLIANNDPERVKQALRAELRSVSRSMAESIAERFARLSPDERRAIDATLRLVRRSATDLLFRTESGKHLANAGREFDRFFAAVKAEAPSIKELRYENLIVEKAIFNKLLMKTKPQDYTIWVPSLYAKENSDYLIERAAVPSEHLLRSRLAELKSQGLIEGLRNFLDALIEGAGVIPKPAEVPEAVSDYLSEQGGYYAMSPLELDDVISFFQREEEERAAARRAEQERERKILEEKQREEEARRAEQARLRRRQAPAELVEAKQQPQQQQQLQRVERAERTTGGIYLGKQLDAEQFFGAIGRRLPEKDLATQVKVGGDYYVENSAVRALGVTIVGSSGSGRSTTLKRLLDGLGSSGSKVFVIDQKGEHRGVAWKHQWTTFGFARDSQAHELRVRLPPAGPDSAELLADLIQEWCLQSGISCTDQQRARIFSVIMAQQEKASSEITSVEDLVSELSKEAELAQIGSKLSKNLVGKGNLQRIFSKDCGFELTEGSSTLVDISGRGLRDPTTKEERLMLSVLLIREFLSKGAAGYVIVLEDVLDRLKSESLQRKMIEMISKLKQTGNSVIATARGPVREYLGRESIEILHRLSGEKAVSDELAGFVTDLHVKNLASLVGFLPRGYAITSKFAFGDSATSSAVVRVEPLQFGTQQ